MYFLERKPKRIHADVFTFIAISKSTSSRSQILTRVCKVLTEGANRITTAAYRKIAAQHGPILQRLLALLTSLTEQLFMRSLYGYII